MKLCDFCNQPDPRPAWLYATGAFTVMLTPTVGAISDSSWLACGDCRRLIDADDREGLAQRYAAHSKVPLSVDRLTVLAAEMQGHFFKHRLPKAPTLIEIL